MFACTELVTGYDDFGNIIFLQARCRRGGEGAAEGCCVLCGDGSEPTDRCLAPGEGPSAKQPADRGLTLLRTLLNNDDFSLTIVRH